MQSLRYLSGSVAKLDPERSAISETTHAEAQDGSAESGERPSLAINIATVPTMCQSLFTA